MFADTENFVVFADTKENAKEQRQHVKIAIYSSNKKLEYKLE